MLHTHSTLSYTHKSKPNSIIMYSYYSERCRLRPRIINSTVSRRHHYRRRLLKYSPDPTSTPTIFKPSADTLQITTSSSNSLKHILGQSEIKLNRLIECGREAFDDLKTLVVVDCSTEGVVISCRRSAFEFLAALLMSSLVIIFIFKGLLRRRKGGSEVLVYERDRNLGGREVPVGKEENWGNTPRTTPLSLNDYNDDKKTKNTRLRLQYSRKEELPQWWPQLLDSGSNVDEMLNREEYQRMANRLVRAMMGKKMAGKDISADDITQLRHISKTFGVRVSTETTIRDSLYEAAMNLVLSYCEIIANARYFISGFADDIGLENTRAAGMLSAAVAGRTQSRILLAWELEAQGKHSEALLELSKVCLIHRVFPPSKCSPEMEMVARGLENHLSLEQRESILESLTNVGGEEIHGSLVEALGLVGIRDNRDAEIG